MESFGLEGSVRQTLSLFCWPIRESSPLHGSCFCWALLTVSLVADLKDVKKLRMVSNGIKVMGS